MEQQDVARVDSDPPFRLPNTRRDSGSSSSTPSTSTSASTTNKPDAERQKCHQCKNVSYFSTINFLLLHRGVVKLSF